MPLLYGCVADDFTGATDLAGNLAARGIRTRVITGATTRLGPVDDDIDAIVVALKTRTAPVAQAVDETIAAFRALRDAGASRLYFKYCSTFDSTDAGNIGPVIDAALDLVSTGTGARATIAVPSFPANGRTVYRSHLFVGDQLLENSSMRHHPLTPMTESDLRVLLERQGETPVAAIHLDTVRRGEDAIRTELDALGGRTIVVIDAVDDDDLAAIARASAHLPLVTGGSGLALGFDSPRGSTAEPTPVAQTGRAAIVCGSASSRTLEQIQAAKDAGLPFRKIDPAAGVAQVEEIVAWAESAWAEDAERPVLVFATDSPADIVAPGSADHAAQAERIEATLAETMQRLVEAGARRLIAAGGETSGRVVTHLGIDSLLLTRRIAPGVSWADARTASGHDVSLALKSGNFGDAGFFSSAFEALR
ncbi:MAG: 3-oxo-tetronate kinase [Microbacteriaceae bacterium]